MVIIDENTNVLEGKLKHQREVEKKNKLKLSRTKPEFKKSLGFKIRYEEMGAIIRYDSEVDKILK